MKALDDLEERLSGPGEVSVRGCAGNARALISTSAGRSGAGGPARELALRRSNMFRALPSIGYRKLHSGGSANIDSHPIDFRTQIIQAL